MAISLGRLFFFFFNLLPMALVGFKESLDGWPPLVSSGG